MSWTTPTTRATGYLVTAATYNADIVNNLLYLHGDAGLTTLLSGLSATTLAASSSIASTRGDGGVAFNYNPATAVGYFIDSHVQGEANGRWTATLNGLMSWGPGGSTAVDTNLQRISAQRLDIGGVTYGSMLAILPTSADNETCAAVSWRKAGVEVATQRVSVGAADSGAAGYRLLRIPN